MNRILAVLGVVLLTFSGCSEKKADAGLAAYADSVMSANFKPTRPGAVVLVARDGVPVFRKAYGLANVELGVPNVPENVFAIASMTKQFTAVSILQLVQRGKLSLQDDIRKHLPGFNTHGRIVTVENLLTHTNGILNAVMKPGFGLREIEEPSVEEMLECVKNDSLLFEPGTDISYNDYGFTLAALIVERISGMRYADYLREHVFSPLGMNSTWNGTRERSIPRLVSNYSPAGDTLFRPADYSSWRWDLGMGDMVTNADDMLKWDEALYTEKLVHRDLLAKAWSSFVLADGRAAHYGYGWFLSEYQGMPMIWHTGGMPGWRSAAIRIPSQHLFVIVMSNSGSNNAAVTCAQNIALRAAGRPLSPPVVRRLPAEQLREYAGVYAVRYSGPFYLANLTHNAVYRYVTVHDSVLMSQRTGGSKGALLNLEKDLFLQEGSLTYVRFRRDGNQKVVSAEVYNDPFQSAPSRREEKTTLPIPAEKVPVAVDASILAAYSGKYTFAGDDFLRVRVDRGRIYVDRVGEIFPESPTRFFARSSDARVEFLKNAKGFVTGLIWSQLASEKAKKVE